MCPTAGRRSRWTEAGTDRRWTPQQRAAITHAGGGLLVSAAAGSGKTSVLAERCAHLVCDADPPCGVHELLVVTFTEAAAAEMKNRIGRAIAARHAAKPTTHTARQLAVLDRASISTLHGFCARLLRQHFHLLGLDPAFRILDGDEAALLKQEVAADLFARPVRRRRRRRPGLPRPGRPLRRRQRRPAGRPR